MNADSIPRKEVVKRTNTYVIIEDERSPLVEKMDEQEKSKPFADADGSSDDDEEFIRQSILMNQRKFSILHNDYVEKVFLQKINEADEIEVQEDKPIVISNDETPNKLSKVLDHLNSLNDHQHDKSDRIFTNFDTFLFFLEVSDAIKLQK
jgi:hypothetical protein